MEEFRRKFKFVIYGGRVSVKKLPLKKNKRYLFGACIIKFLVSLFCVRC